MNSQPRSVRMVLIMCFHMPDYNSWSLRLINDADAGSYDVSSLVLCAWVGGPPAAHG